MSKNSTPVKPIQAENRTESAKPVAVVHCYNVTATCIDSRAVVTANTHDTPASAARAKSAQLHALLSATAEAMDGAPQDIRDNLIILATDVAREVRALCELAELATEAA
ncbi:hypothetical protein ACUXAV_000329 [Cupriavidus metallidurans]|uniref:hypothetical protein n=1 Tax=Cupriavidus metallidurans TaxID=119219 RepID=UPI0004932A9C|nr:hypothetical protein [Cupriavidus metallidurans]MDE4918290.1 hypothetical protein [Cupriavidus metallidurans]